MCFARSESLTEDIEKEKEKIESEEKVIHARRQEEDAKRKAERREEDRRLQARKAALGSKKEQKGCMDVEIDTNASTFVLDGCFCACACKLSLCRRAC